MTTLSTSLLKSTKTALFILSFSAATILLFSALPLNSAEAGPSKPAAKAGSQVKNPNSSSGIKVVTASGSLGRGKHKIMFKYPRFSGADPVVCNKLNALVKKAMFEDAYDDLVELTFARTFIDKTSLSTGFTFYRRGGAHRNGFYEALNYRLTPAIKKISLEDFFGGKVNYEKLRTVCAKHIARGMSDTDESRYYEALGTDPDSYKFFIFDSDGVTFTFCQLTCEAFGVQSYKLPYSELQGLFTSSSPVFKYLRAK
jgi:hypothetical protein